MTQANPVAAWDASVAGVLRPKRARKAPLTARKSPDSPVTAPVSQAPPTSADEVVARVVVARDALEALLQSMADAGLNWYREAFTLELLSLRYALDGIQGHVCQRCRMFINHYLPGSTHMTPPPGLTCRCAAPKKAKKTA
jgi:hypothetical protein